MTSVSLHSIEGNTELADKILVLTIQLASKIVRIEIEISLQSKNAKKNENIYLQRLLITANASLRRLLLDNDRVFGFLVYTDYDI